MSMFDDEPLVPVQYPIDAEHPPVFPGRLPRDLTAPMIETLTRMAEQVNPYLGPDHRALRSLLTAAGQLGAASYPKLNGYAEYTPET